MLDFKRLLLAHEGDDVESHLEGDVEQAYVGVGRPHDVLDFVQGHRLFGTQEVEVAAGLHLDHDESRVAVGHQVELHLSAAPVDVANDVSFRDEVFGRPLLAGLS